MLSVSVFDLGTVDMTLIFVGTIVLVGMIQVAILLAVARGMVEVFWKFKLDPDDYVLPLLSALGDLIGTGILVGAFNILAQLGYIHAQDVEEGADPTRSLMLHSRMWPHL